jgi:hypothetical protein
MQWEYKFFIMDSSNADFESKLNELGLVGWELVGMDTWQTYFKCIFKRPLLSPT